MKTLLVIFIAIICQCLGDVCLTRGMKSIGEVSTLDPAQLLAVGVQIFSTPLIWLGIGILLVFFLLNLAALSWADLTYVVPLSAFGYVVNAAMSKYLLGEQVTAARWIGTTLICLGVMIVSRTEQRTTEQQAAEVKAA